LPGAKSVVACLSHADRDVRRAAVKVLAGWQLAGVSALVEALGQNDEPTLLGATTALALVLDETRRTIVENPQAESAAREEALQAMLSQALPALAARMADPRSPIAASARRAVAVIGLPAAAHLVTMLASADAAQRNAAAAALRELEDYLPPPGKLPSHLAALRAALVPQLITALKSSERTTRIAALRLFATLEIGPEGAAALPQLQAALKDEDVAVRSDAAQALDRVQKAM
jgi:HEAT repeat protein